MENTKELFDIYIKYREKYLEITKIYDETCNVINSLCRKIWAYIYDNYAEYLKYGKRSEFDNWDLECDFLCIEYFQNYYEFDTELFHIPLSVIYNDTWKEFIDNHFNKIKAEEVDREAKEKEKRRKLYEELKKEFES